MITRKEIEDLLILNSYDVIDNDHSGGGYNNGFLSSKEIIIEAWKENKPMLFIAKHKGVNSWMIEEEEYIRVNPIKLENIKELEVLLKQLEIL